jgi:uncharacterized membrane protein
MEIDVTAWLSLGLRWAHVISAITWIGHAFFFNWLDASLDRPEGETRPGVEGELWMVHSGGFYQVEKKLVAPDQVPRTLHWFKWEAAFTWITGALLLVETFYMHGGMLLIDPDRPVSHAAAVGIGVATLLVGWLVYDGLCRSPVGAAPVPMALVSFALLVGVGWFLTGRMSGRGAYIHVGALMGTIMVANVWICIIPAQNQLLAAVREGRKPDPEMALRAKQRSRHNNYMGYPVVVLMVSNHYPTLTYGSDTPWQVLGGLLLAGALVRHAMNMRMHGAASR